MREDLEQLVVAYVESLNAADLERLRVLLAPDIEYVGFGAGARASGIASVLATVEYIMGTDPGTRTTIRHMVLDAETNEAVAFLSVSRSNPELPTLLVTTLLAASPEGQIARLVEQHQGEGAYKDPGCFSWKLDPVPPAPA